MKIGILTFNSAHNYGAVLQAWALQEKLTGMGHTAEIINYRLPEIDTLYQLYDPESPYESEFRTKRWNRRQYNEVKKNKPDETASYEKFEHFINEVLHTTKPYYSPSQLAEADFEYDAVIAGSDQIWNYTLTKGVQPEYLLNFINDKTIKISYAASIGGEHLKEKDKLIFGRYLRDFDYISVREEAAQREINELLGYEAASLTADPTFLIEKSNYDTIKIKPETKGQKYIYVHNVHRVRNDSRLNETAEKLSAMTGLPVVYNKKEYKFKNTLCTFTDGGPREFIGWIEGAEYVVTNSFHATAFALIYNRKFVTVPHITNPGRMRYLLCRLGLDRLLVDSAEKLPALSELEIDYALIHERIKQYREESEIFLNTALKGKKVKHNGRFGSKFECCGCSACREICPRGAIVMQKDEEGFIYPIINNELCNKCGKCVDVCPAFHAVDMQGEVYKTVYRDAELPFKTALSSAFKPFVQMLLGTGAVVFVDRAEVNNGKASVSCIEIDTEGRRLDRIYDFVPVEAGDNGYMRIIRGKLEEGKTVIYIGKGCHIAGLKNYLGREYEGLFTMSVRCEGVISADKLNKYLTDASQQFKSEVADVVFQNRISGWYKPMFCVTFESEEALLELGKTGIKQQYKKRNLQRPFCYVCGYAKAATPADITVVPCAAQKTDTPLTDKYAGMVYLHIASDKGRRLFEECRDVFSELALTENDVLEAEPEDGALKLTSDRNKYIL